MYWKLFLLFSVVFVSSCKTEEEETSKNDYVFSGTIIDQVSQQPVAGVSVYFGSTFCDAGDQIIPHSQPAVSDGSGKYKLIMTKQFYTKWGWGNCKYFFAKKEGYKGSNVFNAPQESSSTVNFELYHPAEFRVRMKNDTINNSVDSVKLWLIGDMSFSGHPGFAGVNPLCLGGGKIMRMCKGRKFDSTFVFNSLWGNVRYTVDITQAGSFPLEIASYTITPKPDETGSISITF